MITLNLIILPDGGEVALVPTPRIEAAAVRTRSQVAEIRKKVKAMQSAYDTGAAEFFTSTNPPPHLVELAAAIKGETAVADDLEAATASAIAGEKALREKWESKIVAVNYEFRPYTDGQKQDARAEATTYEGGNPKLDLGRYHRLLVAACCGLSITDVRGMSPARVEALISEVIERSEPDPSRLDFLF